MADGQGQGSAQFPVQLIVAAFPEEKRAEAALADLKKAKSVEISDAAILRKDAKGELHISETGDMSGKRGGVVGGVVGAGLAIVTGGATLALAGLGAAAGGLAAKLRDTGFKDERLRQLGQNLQPGSSAIVAVIEHQGVAEGVEHLRAAGANVVVEAIDANIAQQLQATQVSVAPSSPESGAPASGSDTPPAQQSA